MMPDLFVLARVLHVSSIVGWIGGVWFVTFVIMPAITRSEPPALRMSAFHRIEQGFSRQAKFWVLLAGLTGFWMTEQADGQVAGLRAEPSQLHRPPRSYRDQPQTAGEKRQAVRRGEQDEERVGHGLEHPMGPAHRANHRDQGKDG